MTTKTDTQAAFEKWLGARADDPSLPHGLMRDAFCAGVEADRQGRMPSDEEIDKLSHGFALQYQDHVRGFARALLSRYSSGLPAASAELTDLGLIRVGRLPTMNQDEYPDLSDWWVQLRIGNDGDEVLARVYGDTPEQARSRAVALAAPVAAQAQRVVNQQMTTAASDVLADTQRMIIEAAEQRGYARAIAECAQDREDAERYRWLRPFGVAGLSDAQSFLQCQMVDGNTDHGRMMDAAIDAARAAKGE